MSVAAAPLAPPPSPPWDAQLLRFLLSIADCRLDHITVSILRFVGFKAFQQRHIRLLWMRHTIVRQELPVRYALYCKRRRTPHAQQPFVCDIDSCTANQLTVRAPRRTMAAYDGADPTHDVYNTVYRGADGAAVVLSPIEAARCRRDPRERNNVARNVASTPPL